MSIAATLIQCTWRRFIAAEYFIFMLSDVIVCQSVARRKIAMMRYESVLAQREMAANMIRAAFFGYITRMNYLITVNNVVTCQCAARQMLAKRELRELKQLQWAENFMRKEAAATKIRAAYLGYTMRINYIIMIGRVISCQCEARRWMARKRLEEVQNKELVRKEKGVAATKIRAVYLGYITRTNYLIMIGRVVSCQCAARRWMARKRLEETQMRKFARKENAATKIRASYLGYIARSDYLITIAFAITLQCAVRAMVAKNKLCDRRRQVQWDNKNSLLIQTTWRRYIISTRQMAAVAIQKSFRGFKERLDFRMMIADVITIQTIARRWSALRQFFTLRQIQRAKEHAAATKIIAYYVGYIERMCFHANVKSAITCQSAIRGLAARKQLLIAKDSATKIQKSLRGYQARKRHSLNVIAATRIQSCWRCYKTQTDYAYLICGFTSLQAKIRQLLAKAELTRRRKHWQCAIQIQSCWRSYIAQLDYASVIWAATFIQTTLRCHIRVKKYRQHLARRASAAVTIQAAFRGYNHYVGKYYLEVE